MFAGQFKQENVGRSLSCWLPNLLGLAETADRLANRG
jgi:hypothetical protein